MIRRLAILLLAFGCTAGCDSEKTSDSENVSPPATAGQQQDEPTDPTDVAEEKGPTDVESALRRLQSQIDFRQTRGAETGGWLHYGYLAHAFLARAHLTGAVEDYLAARDALEKGFDRAGDGKGPYLARAAYHLATNRIGAVEADLGAFEKNPAGADARDATVAGLRGDVAFRKGDLEKALKHYRDEERIDTTIGAALRRAKYHTVRGEWDEAKKWYARAVSRADDSTGQRAMAFARRGDLDLETGHPGEALKWYRKADDVFSGWYFVESRLAAAHRALGDHEEAIELYERVYERVPRGRFAADLAATYRLMGNTEAAREWQKKATDAFDRDLERLAPLVRRHAVEFFSVTDPDRGVKLARDDFEVSPGHAERVRLARALLRAGKPPSEAAEVLEPTMDSGWATAEFLATAAVALRNVDPERATDMAGRASSIDPDAVLTLEKSLPE